YVRSAEGAVVDRAATDHGDATAASCEASDFLAPVRGEDLGSNVLDVQGPTERFAGFAGVPGEQHGLHADVGQVLDRGPRTGTEAVLEPYYADEAASQRHQQHRSTETFQLVDLALGAGHADPLLEHQRAAADHQALSARRDRGDPEPWLCGVASGAVRADTPRARSSQHGGGHGVAGAALGAGDQREHRTGIVFTDRLDVGYLGFAE